MSVIKGGQGRSSRQINDDADILPWLILAGLFVLVAFG